VLLVVAAGDYQVTVLDGASLQEVMCVPMRNLSGKYSIF